jgi:hypothetical protein
MAAPALTTDGLQRKQRLNILLAQMCHRRSIMSSKLYEKQDRPNLNADEFLSADIPSITPKLLNYPITQARRLRSEATLAAAQKTTTSLRHGRSRIWRRRRQSIDA